MHRSVNASVVRMPSASPIRLPRRSSAEEFRFRVGKRFPMESGGGISRSGSSLVIRVSSSLCVGLHWAMTE